MQFQLNILLTFILCTVNQPKHLETTPPFQNWLITWTSNQQGSRICWHLGWISWSCGGGTRKSRGSWSISAINHIWLTFKKQQCTEYTTIMQQRQANRVIIDYLDKKWFYEDLQCKLIKTYSCTIWRTRGWSTKSKNRLFPELTQQKSCL